MSMGDRVVVRGRAVLWVVCTAVEDADGSESSLRGFVGSAGLGNDPGRDATSWPGDLGDVKLPSFSSVLVWGLRREDLEGPLSVVALIPSAGASDARWDHAGRFAVAVSSEVT